ncbi:MAG: flagellar hook-basal body protein [Candidatus Tectomicrobia bacterium]|uniref:Flagellar hook-basal body protein n=1 Tax=Tectimicrobiota bacterium TaxID=2528274 RepID=A0A932I1F4_UNCTE|nr:flagellar hook-basal body protein [Candidatus Tectomicrobia bacterium]
MQPGAYSVIAAALLRQRHLEIATNNLANASTVGFKAERPVFDLHQTEAPADEIRPLGGDLVRQSRWAATLINYSGGKTQHTANPLDVSIVGDGFFVLQTPEGRRYTRAGQFALNGSREIVSADGFPVLGVEGRAIRLPAGDKIVIGQTGEVMVGNAVAGRIRVVDFPKPYKLFKQNGAAFSTIDPREEGTPVAAPQLVQGSLELSNVSPISEMVALIETARLYEAYQKIFQSFDSMSDRAVNDLGRTQSIA